MKKHDRGWAMLEVGATLLLIMVIVAYAAGEFQNYLKTKNWKIEATKASSYAAAVRSYVGRNYATLANSTTSTTPVVITTAMLKNTGFLPNGFAETNSLGQHMRAYVVKNGQNPELLQAMVVSSEGQPFSVKALITMAKDISVGFGGYIEDGQTAVGSLRSWQIPLSSYGAVSGRGHIAILLSTDELSGAQEDNDRLYRFQVNGRPDLNSMHTSIDMGANNINNIDNVYAQNGIFNNEIRANSGDFVTNIIAGEEINGKTIKSKENISVGGIIQLGTINIPDMICFQNGDISRDVSGNILSCKQDENGIYSWKHAGSSGSVTRSATNNLSYTAKGEYEFINISISSVFNPVDGWHSSNAIFNLTVNGLVVAQITNTTTVVKAGSRGHYWGYQSTIVSQKMYRHMVKDGDLIQVSYLSGVLHESSDIQLTLSK
ncbi:shufflon system plasmid conjugative transfer pilus tip adhesin PilV [Pectobacterium atrosepticum]|uniref:shufflon system plasmid conjugative transfer pilus tip adhesin PilV n=1 Tax=Pectobacterium atrosepticum TaxID=29471 RepID=UPI00301839F4